MKLPRGGYNIAMAKQRWYPVTRTGKLVTVLYGLLPPYIVYAETLNVFPGVLQIPIIGGLATALLCLGYAKYARKKPFERKHDKTEGFTIVELLVVIAIIGLGGDYLPRNYREPAKSLLCPLFAGV